MLLVTDTIKCVEPIRKRRSQNNQRQSGEGRTACLQIGARSVRKTEAERIKSFLLLFSKKKSCSAFLACNAPLDIGGERMRAAIMKFIAEH
jgi:hypothetical protein